MLPNNANTLATHLKLIIDVLPCVLAFLTTLIWLTSAGPAPLTSVGATALWLLPITTSFVFSIIYHFWHACAIYGPGTPWDFTMFEFGDVVRKRVLFVRSAMSGGVLSLLIGYFLYLAFYGLLDGLKPIYYPDGTRVEDAMGLWVGLIFVGLVLLFFGALLYLAILVVPYYDLKRVRRAYNEVLKEQEDGYNQLSETEDDESEEEDYYYYYNYN